MSDVKTDLVVATVQVDDVQRYLCWHPDKPAFNYEIGAEVVLLSELERVQKISDNYYAICVDRAQELAALREELAKLGDDYCKRMDELTAAEQRNAELVELLEHAYGAIDENDGWRQLCQRILAVIQPDSIGLIKPTESGASE